MGIEELSGIEYRKITEGMVRSMLGLLGPALSKVLATKQLMKDMAWHGMAWHGHGHSEYDAF